ncbi:MAG: PAS domain S-box protein [Chloroflexi bacterium]|jgi:PAS domain S-box-containing protein|nr:PAS domain S-box protein [Chloroflexota bacterium]MBT7080493.1 PAS domain S-box protein [Chloroflexota bacterium]MBT7288932.1 PAS domain S-box protein [Chloroflexota bacterium]
MSETHKKSVSTPIGDVPYVVYRCANDEHRTMEYINGEIEKITGYPASDFIGNNIRSYSSIIHHEDLDSVSKTIQKGVDNKDQYIIEYRLVSKDGSINWVYEIGTPIFDQNGELKWLEGIILDITKRKNREEEKLDHLNRVLYALSDVNRIISSENDRTTMIENVCKVLTQRSGYFNAWIALLDEKMHIVEIAETGLGNEFGKLLELLERNEFTVCGEKALSSSEPILIEDPKLECKDCPLASRYEARGAFVQRLQYKERLYGIITASIPREFMTREEEIRIFKEIAGEVAFSLHNIEIENERKSTQDLLELTRFTVDHAGDMIYWTDSDANIIDTNETVCKVLGYSKEEILSMTLRDIDRNFDEEDWQSNWVTLRESKHYVFHTSHMTKTGDEVPVEVTRNYLFYNGKEYNCAFIHDITERITFEKELHDSRQRISTLDQSVRKEIAQELHGTVQSRLIVLMHRLTELREMVSGNEASTQIDSVQQVLGGVIDDHLRPISRKLYPSILQRGVTVALQSLADQFEQLIMVELNIDEGLISQEKKNKSTIREELGLALYRITEEALNNVVKHSAATNVILNLSWVENKTVVLEIRDNGKGFDLENTRIGLGTNVMQDYAKLLDGDCTIQSTQGEGTTVTVSIPL